MKRKSGPRMPVLGVKRGRSENVPRPPVGVASVGCEARVPDGFKSIGYGSGMYRRGGGMRGAE